MITWSEDDVLASAVAAEHDSPKTKNANRNTIRYNRTFKEVGLPGEGPFRENRFSIVAVVLIESITLAGSEWSTQT